MLCRKNLEIISKRSLGLLHHKVLTYKRAGEFLLIYGIKGVTCFPFIFVIKESILVYVILQKYDRCFEYINKKYKEVLIKLQWPIKYSGCQLGQSLQNLIDSLEQGLAQWLARNELCPCIKTMPWWCLGPD